MVDYSEFAKIYSQYVHVFLNVIYLQIIGLKFCGIKNIMNYMYRQICNIVSEIFQWIIQVTYILLYNLNHII